MTVSAKMTTKPAAEAQPVAYIHPDSISALILAPEGAWMRVFTRGKQPPPDGWTPVYTAPPSAPVGVEGFRTAVEKARRVWMDENPCEDGHDHVTPFDQFLYGPLATQPQGGA